MPTSFDNNYEYDILSFNKARITSYLGPGGGIQIPANLDGYDIITLGNSAFQNRPDITAVTIANGVENIWSYTFSNCINLSSITLPNTLEWIGHHAFSSLLNLTTISIPESISVIDADVFSYCPNLNEAKFWGDAPYLVSDIFRNPGPMFKVIYYSGRSGFTYMSQIFPQYKIEPFYMITYDGNESTDGLVPEDKNTYLQGDTVQVKNNTGSLAKVGYTFRGWNTEEDGNGIDYTPGTSFAIGNDHLMLYAKWTQLPGRGVKLF